MMHNCKVALHLGKNARYIKCRIHGLIDNYVMYSCSEFVNLWSLMRGSLPTMYVAMYGACVSLVI